MRSENLDLSLSIPHNPKAIGYSMSDQTFHTPSFGDEEFDIPAIHGGAGLQGSQAPYTQIHHAAPQVGMMNPAQDGLAPPGGAPSYQQPLYLQEPHTPVTSHSGAGAPAGNYIIQQQPGGQQRLLMMQPTQVMGAPPAPNTPTHGTAPIYGRSPQRASPPGTTSDDSDDSVPSHHTQLPGDAESLLPIHYCSASRQQQSTLHQLGVGNTGIKRPSPEPTDNGINRGQLPKKPKVQKKKKKRDPNEPQKPVSAYALFFRDTQAAIKGQNPNASFGEVSKIVASMWDGLDSDHKNVYKQKTEVAKKEYLKALAAYRASLVSKGEPENQAIYNHTGSSPNSSYGGYYQGQNYGPGHSPQGYVPTSAPQGYSPQGYPPGQSPTGYGPAQSPQNYQPGSAQSPQGFQAGATHSPQTYQAPTGQSPQNYQNSNAGMSPQGYQGNLAQSPQGYQGTQSPQNFSGGAGVSPQGYRIGQSQSPPMQSMHAIQYHHHTQQMQQVRHQQLQQQQQQQHHQQQQQQQQQQHHQQQSTQQQPQSQQQEQQSQPQQNPIEQHSSSNSGNPGIPQQSPSDGESRGTTSCIRQGCTNPAVANSEWEDEYCSNECVVSHCRDVFSSWVASNNNQNQNFSAVK